MAPHYRLNLAIGVDGDSCHGPSVEDVIDLQFMARRSMTSTKRTRCRKFQSNQRAAAEWQETWAGAVGGGCAAGCAGRVERAVAPTPDNERTMDAIPTRSFEFHFIPTPVSLRAVASCLAIAPRPPSHHRAKL